MCVYLAGVGVCEGGEGVEVGVDHPHCYVLQQEGLGKLHLEASALLKGEAL